MRFPLSVHRVSYRLCHPAWVACPSADLARREASPWRLKMLVIEVEQFAKHMSKNGRHSKMLTHLYQERSGQEAAVEEFSYSCQW